MAIQTHGFGVDVMPQVGLADPNLVASNPNQITQGMLHAYALAGAHYNLQETKAKIHAQKKLQDELDALREDRIGAKKAQYGAEASGANISVARDAAAMPNIAPAANLERDKIAALSLLLGPQTQAGIGAANKSINDLKFGESQRGILEQIQGIGNQAALKTAPTDALAKIQLAGNSLSQAELNSRKIADAGEFADFDANAERQKTAAGIELTKAQTAKDNAIAKDVSDKAARERLKLDAIREKSSSLEKDTIALEKLAESETVRVSRIGNRPASNPAGGKVPFKVAELFSLAYEQNDKDEWVPRKNGIFNRKDIQLTPTDKANLELYRSSQAKEAKYLSDANEYRQQLLENNRKLRASSLQETQDESGQISEQDAGAIKFVGDAKNKSHPRYKAILDELIAKGLIK